MQKLVVERDQMVCCGKKVEISQQHQRRKLTECESADKSALWFAESVGLIPESLNVCTSGSGEPISVQLSGSKQLSTSPECRKVDKSI